MVTLAVARVSVGQPAPWRSTNFTGNAKPLLVLPLPLGALLFCELRELLCVAGFHSPSNKCSSWIRADPPKGAAPLHQGAAAGEDVHGAGGESGRVHHL